MPFFFFAGSLVNIMGCFCQVQYCNQLRSSGLNVIVGWILCSSIVCTSHDHVTENVP